MQVFLIQSAIADMFAQVSYTGVVTLADRYGLLAAVLDESLSDEERRAIDRVLRAVCRGRLKVVDELSSVM
ncbi:hypothetical protein H6F67_25130 [Microcoleus sp. FACHB-1515]|uniref:hypothetical protein n=1 Tax=Cyanophyceae TaxID=3028117 RepID=UPI0016889BC9|nr:hypothetical protein [Microcoleus sp. FACHB-1515]MBD2093132.1 hypothetical protein [Microcoleus sp. FACHB-1515]